MLDQLALVLLLRYLVEVIDYYVLGDALTPIVDKLQVTRLLFPACDVPPCFSLLDLLIGLFEDRVQAVVEGVLVMFGQDQV